MSSGETFDDISYEDFNIDQNYWMLNHAENLDVPYVPLRGQAIVIDPHFELSEQQIIFPTTPVTSYSTTYVYLGLVPFP